MQRHVKPGILFLVLSASGCADDNPLHGPPREADENAYRDLSLRPSRRSDSSPVLLADAESAWQRGARTASLVLSVAGLETGDRSPSLLGLAATAAGSVRPRVQGERWLPACQTLTRTLRRTSAFCVGTGASWVQRDSGPWQPLAAAVRDALWTADQGVVLLASGQVETLDGTRLGEGDPDGTLLATGNDIFVFDGVQVRSVHTGASILDGVRAVARARSGTAWAARLDNEVFVQDLLGERRLETSAQGDHLVLSPLGGQVASVGPQGVDLLAGPVGRTLWAVPVSGPVAVSEEGDVAAATTNGEVAWRTPDGVVHRVSARPRSLRFDSRSLVVHTEDGRLRTWAPPRAELGSVWAEPTVVLHRVRGRMLQVLEDGQWQVFTANRRRTVAAGQGPVRPVAAALHPTWSHAALATADGITLVAAEGRQSPPMRHAWTAPRAVAWSRRDDKDALSVLDARGLHWLGGETVHSPAGQPFDALAWRGGLAWVSGSERAERWSASARGVVQPLTQAGATAAVAVPVLNAVVFSTPEGVVLQGADGNARWADPLSFEDVRTAALAPNGDRLALGGARGRVAVVDSSGVSLLETPPLGPHAVRQVVWTGDRRLLALDEAGTVHLIDVAVLDARPDRLWGQLVWSAGVSLAPGGDVAEAPWRVSPPALPSAGAAPGLP